jgi:hypothetical protein
MNAKKNSAGLLSHVFIPAALALTTSFAKWSAVLDNLTDVTSAVACCSPGAVTFRTMHCACATHRLVLSTVIKSIVGIAIQEIILNYDFVSSWGNCGLFSYLSEL